MSKPDPSPCTVCTRVVDYTPSPCNHCVLYQEWEKRERKRDLDKCRQSYGELMRRFR
jgi:hypothetical protein